MNSKDIIVFGTIAVVIVCVIAGVVISNTGNNNSTPAVTPTVIPTISPTPTPTPTTPDIYYIPNEERHFADKYPIGTEIGEENPPAFTPSPK